ncbi:hypothetical protein [Halostella salina]|uniref:hypothetical protein n=1 Tax=Halostella salina TaxID=1547897 RepID=UPI000EF77BC6|nr:hypothetical protein [Halostella salina]
MAYADERRKDLVTMTFAIQLTVVGLLPNAPTFVLLFFLGVVLTAVVGIREAGRRYAEYAADYSTR